jgi:hypothetical protein
MTLLVFSCLGASRPFCAPSEVRLLSLVGLVDLSLLTLRFFFFLFPFSLLHSLLCVCLLFFQKYLKEPEEKEHSLIKHLHETYKGINQQNLQSSIHDATQYRVCFPFSFSSLLFSSLPSYAGSFVSFFLLFFNETG